MKYWVKFSGYVFRENHQEKGSEEMSILLEISMHRNFFCSLYDWYDLESLKHPAKITAFSWAFWETVLTPAQDQSHKLEEVMR